MKKALITGIAGQDASYLTEFLLTAWFTEQFTGGGQNKESPKEPFITDKGYQGYRH